MKIAYKAWDAIKLNRWIENNAALAAEAGAKTVNTVVAYGKLKTTKAVKDRFVLRNRYVLNSIKTMRSKPYSRNRSPRQLSKINAWFGTTNKGLLMQEIGGQIQPKSGSRTITIGTQYARISRNAHRAVSRRYRMDRAKNTRGIFYAKIGKGHGLFRRINKKKIVLMQAFHKRSSVKRIRATHFFENVVRHDIKNNMVEKIFLRELRKYR